MIADLIDLAQKSGNLPMQVLMLLGVIVLGLVFRSYYGSTERKFSAVAIEHGEQMRALADKMDKQQESMNQERRERISSLMTLIKEDTTAKNEMSSAVRNNTDAIRELRDFIRQQELALKAAINRMPIKEQ
jgi:GTP-binding protein EngB required for normal cell division